MQISIKSFVLGIKKEQVIERDLDITETELYGRKVVFTKKPHMVVKLVKKSDDRVWAQCKVDLCTSIECVRCLDTFDAEETVCFDGYLSNLDDEMEADLILTDNDELSLEELLDIALFEHLNNNSLCREDCKGLCPVCATNLNHNKCNCKEEDQNIDPRFLELKKLFSEDE